MGSMHDNGKVRSKLLADRKGWSWSGAFALALASTWLPEVHAAAGDDSFVIAVSEDGIAVSEVDEDALPLGDDTLDPAADVTHVAEAAFTSLDSVSKVEDQDPFLDSPKTPAGAIKISRAAVGFSYWWGGAAFKTDGNHGSCHGACGDGCTHSGHYGADCSGLIAKVWQLAGALPSSRTAGSAYVAIRRDDF